MKTKSNNQKVKPGIGGLLQKILFILILCFAAFLIYGQEFSHRNLNITPTKTGMSNSNKDSPADEFSMHWPQMPLPDGWNIGFAGSKLTDDFLCANGGYINHIRFWISWKNDEVQDIDHFSLSFWNDSFSGKSNIPGQELWSKTFFAGEFLMESMPPKPQGWFDPEMQHWVPNNTQTWFEITINITSNPFLAQLGNIYWMILDFGDLQNIGWKETEGPHFNSPCLYQSELSGSWIPVVYDQTKDNLPIDLAFVLAEEELLNLDVAAMPDSVCSGEPVQLNAMISGGSGNYNLTWFSIPEGFYDTTNNHSPVVNPSLPTTYYAAVWDGLTWLADSVKVWVPTVSCPPDTMVCPDAPPFYLTGGLPEGGSYSGNGVMNGIFFPMMAGIGTHTITYTVIDSFTGCSDFCTFSVFVMPDCYHCQEIPYVTGWNWISFNCLPLTPTVANVMADFPAKSGDILKNQSQTILFNGIAWVPNLTINPDRTYLLKTSNTPGTFCVIGNYIDPIDPISITPYGWTWIAYKPIVQYTPKNAFTLTTGSFTNQDIIKNQTQTAIYNATLNNWIPSTFKMNPGYGYKLKYQSTVAGTLMYPASDNTMSPIIERADGAEISVKLVSHDTDWVYSPGMETNMSVYVTSATLAGVPVRTGKVAAFHSLTNQCRAVEEFFDGNGMGQVILTVGFNANETGDTFYYLVWDSANEVVYRVKETGVMVADDFRVIDLSLSHNADLNYSICETNGLSKANSLKLTSTGISDPKANNLKICPNPSTGIFTIEGCGNNVKTIIYNTFGDEIFFNETNLPAKIDLSIQPRGIYFIRIETGTSVFFEKLIIK